MSIPENRTLRGAVIDYTSDRTLPLNECKIYFSPVQAGEGTPSPENVREISGWDSVTVYGFNKRLPDEYCEVEYLESTGTQYFWTNVDIQDGLTVDSIQTIANGNDSYLFGGKGDANTDSKTCFNGCYSSHVQGAYPNNYYNIGTVTTNNQVKYHIVTTHADNKRICIINNTQISNVSVSNFTPTTGKCLCFGWNKYGTPANFYKGKVYSLKVSKNDILLANYVPCYRISDHTPGMFDLVSNQFYTNSGTGNFILGPEVGITIDFPKTIYGGYVDLIRGEIVEDYIAMDENGWVQFRQNNGYIAYRENPQRGTTKYKSWYSNIIGNYGSFMSTSMNKNIIQKDTAGGDICLALDENVDITTLQLVISITTPISYSIDPQDLRLLRGANKFSSNSNDNIEISFAAEEYPQLSGNIVTFNSPVAGKQFEECKIYFSPIQSGSGDPSPDNVRPISGWDGVTVMNNTLIAPAMFWPYWNSTKATTVFDQVNNTISVTTLAVYSGCYCKINIKANTEYKVGCTYQFGNAFTRGSIAIMKNDNSTVLAQTSEFTGNGKHSKTFNSGNNTEVYVRFYTSRSNNYNNVTTVLSNMFFVESSINENTSYSRTILFPQTIYGGYVDLVRGEVVETQTKVTIDGNNIKCNYGSYTSTNYYGAGWVYAKPAGQSYYQNYDRSLYLCDRFTLTTTIDETKPHYSYPNSGSLYYIFRILAKTDYQDELTTAQVKDLTNEWLQENPVTIVYPLTIPNTYPLTPETITTLKGINNIFSNANGNITVRAIGNVPSPIHSSDLLRREINGAPHIESKTGNYLTFNTDMEMPLTSGKIYFTPKQDLHGYSKPWVGGAGKNLFDGNYFIQNATTYKTSSIDAIAIILKPNTSYTISTTCPNSKTLASYDDVFAWTLITQTGNPTTANDGINNNSSRTLITGDNGVLYIGIRQNTSKNFIFDGGSYTIQLELGSTATAYEPYENICPIEGWDGITVNRTGKNFVPNDDPNNPNLTYGHTSTGTTKYNVEERGFYSNGNGVTTRRVFTAYKDMTVTFSVEYKNVGTVYGIRFSKNGARILDFHGNADYTWVHSSRTVTLNKNDYLSIMCYGGIYWRNIQIEEGSTATPYEPYQGITQTIQFPKTIYGGYVDLVSEEVVETWNSKTIDGTNIQDYAGNGYSGTQCTNRYITFTPNSSQSYLTNTAISNYLESKKYAVWSNANNYPNCFTINGGYQLHVCFLNDIVGITSGDSNTVKTNKIKAYLTNHPMQLVYPLKTADIGHYSITMQPIITLSGTNNLWTTANGDAQISYYRHSDDSYQYVNAQAIASNNNYLLVTDDGFVIGNEENVTVY